MTYQQRLFDGYAVAKEKAKFGTIDIEDEDVSQFRAGDVIVFVGVATVQGGTFKMNNDGDFVRTNNMSVSQMRVSSGVMKDEIVEFYNLAGDELPFPKKPKAAAAAPAAAPAAAATADDDEDDEDEDASVTAQPASQGGSAAHRDPALASFLGEVAEA